MDYLTLLAIGLAAGVLGGMFGIGGGLIIVPALVFILKVNETNAIATSLAALVPPVGLLGAINYYRTGHINITYAGLIAVGLFLGVYVGSFITIGLPPHVVRRVFAVFLLFVAARMLWFGK